MPYERSLEIEDRLQRVLELVASGQDSSPEIAEILGVSVPTVSRCITALRERGHLIHAKKKGSSWRYVVSTSSS